MFYVPPRLLPPIILSSAFLSRLSNNFAFPSQPHSLARTQTDNVNNRPENNK